MSEQKKSVNRDPDGPPEKVDVTQLHNAIMREKFEPKDGYEPIPMWMVAVLGAFVFFGGFYVAKNSMDFKASVLDGSPPPVLASVAAAPQPVDPMELGKRLYTANCVSCHGANGAGQAGTYPPLDGSEWVQGEPARVARVVLHGLSGPVKVKGATYNGSMPTFGVKVNDEKLSAILTYIRGSWSNKATPITPDIVAKARAATKDRKEPWGEADLLTVTKPD